MEKSFTRKKDWILTPEALELLLGRLDSDRDRAAQRYEQLRKALVVYFEHHGSLSATEHTDDTFDRVARSLTEGKEIYIENPAGYFYGVARNVLRQYRREKANSFLPLDDPPTTRQYQTEAYELFRQAKEHPDYERRLECLEGCLSQLPEENRDLMLRYYEGEASVKIENRKRLAHRLGVSINGLRVRAMRCRERLELCVEQCFAAT